MAAGKNMYEVLWERMDELVIEYYNIGGTGVDKDPALSGEMRGLGFAIEKFSHPFLQEDRAVARLAWKRYKAIRAGEQMPDTPGVAGYNPLPPGAIRATVKPKPFLSPTTVEQILKGIQSGFSVTTLADIYKVPTSVVMAVADGKKV